MIDKMKKNLRNLFPRNDKTSRRDFLLNLMPKNSICAEIGVWKGDFSERILNITNPKELHLIDPWKYEPGDVYENTWYGSKIKSQINMEKIYNNVLNRFKKEINNKIVYVHRKKSEEAATDFVDNYFDWVYIDGNHLYEYVKNDLHMYHTKVKVGGYITGDDYIEGGWHNSGIKNAVDEYIVNVDVELIKVFNKQFIIQNTKRL